MCSTVVGAGGSTSNHALKRSVFRDNFNGPAAALPDTARAHLAALFIIGMTMLPAAAGPKSLIPTEMYQRVRPAVVGIDCLTADGNVLGSASGFLVSGDGRILTNLHVIAACASLTVRVAGEKAYDSTYVISGNPGEDLALIRIKAASVAFLRLADSDQVRVGQPVYSISNRTGLGDEPQQILVSGVRQVNGHTVIEVPTAITPGDSGGPIIDEQGNVIAIAVQKANSASNPGFAIPINDVKALLGAKNEAPFAAFAAAVRDSLASRQRSGQSAQPSSPAGLPPGGVPGGVVGGIVGSVPSAAPPPPNSGNTSAGSPQLIRVGGNVNAANLIRKVMPIYPPLAKAARIQGTVRFTAVIDKNGNVESLELVTGHPLLVEAARQAVSQWVYKPVRLNGEPVRILTQIDVNFSLDSRSESAPPPKLVMEPTIIADSKPPDSQAPNFGDPLTKYGIPSNGNGSGRGVASCKGAGVGPREGGGYGGDVRNIGSVDKKPQLVYKVEPDYSEEASKAKFQGTVVLAIVVDESGLPHDVCVVRPLGLGLDHKAIEAVEKWRFRPGMKDGRPVKVAATIEVNFRLH